MTGGLFNNGAAPNALDVRAFFDSSVTERLAGVIDLGVLVSIGTSRDRGAISFTILHDGERDREYFRDPTEAADYLAHAAHALLALGCEAGKREAPSVPLATRRRQKLSRGPS